MKRCFLMIVLACLAGCTQEEKEETTLVLAAASSMHAVFEEVVPMFEQKNPDIKIQATFDGSGKLQAQIEQGLAADLFLPASQMEMDELIKGGWIDEESKEDVISNQLVFATFFEEDDIVIKEACLEASIIAIGDPDSVPAGNYAKQALDNMGIWDAVYEKLSVGTNVSEVLQWIHSGGIAVGFVYESDALNSGLRYQVVEEALLESEIVYPVGILKHSENKDAAERFISFLNSKEVNDVFLSHGFHVAEE